MKALKLIIFFCLAALLAGCSAETSAAEEAVPSQTETTAPITEELSETMSSSAPEEIESKEDEVSLEELFADSTHNYRELNKPKETENPTMAEQIYQTLYDFADFYDYRNCYMSFFMDRNDVISVERIAGRSNRDLEDSPELFGRQNWEKYYRVTGGRITTGKEYFYQLCQCVSNHYLADGDRDGFETAFQLSEGHLYLTEYAIEGDPMAPASSVLEKISRIGEDRLLLSFTAVTKSLHPEIDEIVRTEQYTVTMSYEHDRWKVDECESRARELLCNEIIQGGTTGADPKTNLPEQIERCLRETKPTEENFYPMRAGEGKKVFEEGKKYLDLSVDGVSYDYELLNKPEETEDPTLAEQLYRALYDFAVFFQYTDPYRLQYLTDQRDTVTIEGFSVGALPIKPETDKDYVRTCEHIFRRVKYGEITTLGEYFSRLLQTASPAFLHSTANLFEKQFVLSNGNLYLTTEPDAYTYIKSDADTRLNGIRKILSAASGETMELSFTASYEMYDLPYTEDYTVTLSYDEDYGWRVADCSTPYAVGFLVSEILEGGRNHESPKTDLLEEIELWLGQIGLM